MKTLQIHKVKNAVSEPLWLRPQNWRDMSDIVFSQRVASSSHHPGKMSCRPDRPWPPRPRHTVAMTSATLENLSETLEYAHFWEKCIGPRPKVSYAGSRKQKMIPANQNAHASIIFSSLLSFSLEKDRISVNFARIYISMGCGKDIYKSKDIPGCGLTVKRVP